MVMSEKFLEFMTLQSKYGKSAYFLDDLIFNNDEVKSNTDEVLSIAEKIQDNFRISCREIIEINDEPGLHQFRKEDECNKINAKLLSNIAFIIHENMSIKHDSKVDEYIIAQNMINHVFNPMVEVASEINSILNKNLTI